MKFKVTPVILCGGSGTRLWPESREAFPKQFIPVINGKSLFDFTLKRLKKIKHISNPVIIANANYQYLIKDALIKQNINAIILSEPIGKNTTAAIYLATKVTGENETLLIMPSDHYIGKSSVFIQSINKILTHDISTNWITFGVTPNYPSTSFGYIKINKKACKENLFEVKNFIEKPNIIRATNFIKSKNYLWNSGIFIGTNSMISNSIKKNAPTISKSCDSAFDKVITSKSNNEYSFNLKDFKQIPSMSIDSSVIEKSSNVLCAPINCRWNDIGSWDRYFECFPPRKNQNVIQVNSKNNFIKSKKKLIATIGIEDLIIVDTDDATLVAKKGLEENMRDLIFSLEKKNILQLKENSFENRPWGRFENILINKCIKIKKITVHPKSKLSKQYHNFRSEHWLITEGKALVYKDGHLLKLKKGDSIDIPKKSIHYIENYTKNILIFIEIQMGDYFGEDDIIRIDDLYGRK